MNKLLNVLIMAVFIAPVSLHCDAGPKISITKGSDEIYEQAERAIEAARSPRETQHAINLYAKAAKAGNQFANHQLGMIYLSGLRVPKDEQRGIAYLLLSAEQGLLTSQIVVAAYFERVAVTKSASCRAYFWWARAVENGEIDAIAALERVHRKCVEAVSK